MKRSRRLDPVARFAHQQERNAARSLGDSMRQVEQQQKRLEDLVAYRDQYVAGFQQAGQHGLTAVQLRDYQVFLSRLDNAIAQQQQLLEESRRNCEQSQVEWQDKHGHSKMIDKVIEDRKQAEDRLEDKQEQREQDDRPKGSNGRDTLGS